jgi:nucleoside-diphosphate-sugar epimerase
MVDAAESKVTDGETYFIGSEEFYSWNRIRDVAVRAMKRRVITVRFPRGAVPYVARAAEWVGRISRNYPALNREKADEILHACKMCSVEKAMRDFGYRQEVTVHEGFDMTVEWYKRAGWLK